MKVLTSSNTSSVQRMSCFAGRYNVLNSELAIHAERPITTRSGHIGWLRKMVALLLDLENLMHTSFVIEAYRTVERAHGQPPTKCFAFGSHLHVGHTEDVAKRLGIEVVTTRYGVKNAADYELVRVAGTLWPHLSNTIVVGSGDRGFEVVSEPEG